MESYAPVQSASERYTKVASSVHTISVLAILGMWAFIGWITIGQMRVAPNPNRVRLYLLTFIFEWLVFAFVVAGVRRSGAPLRMVLGDRWQSVRQVLRDIGIAAGFWIVSIFLLVVLGRILHLAVPRGKMDFMLPHGRAEMTLWVPLSITAGICEETICRGYLQQQFIALTRSAPGGIVLAAAAFGVLHAYQGFQRVILMTLFGAMFGVLAHWRGNVRPGMIAHAWHDSFAGVLGSLMRH